VVELPKTEEGLGFNVMGGKEQNLVNHSLVLVVIRVVELPKTE
jgi:hypothetical protein